MLIDFVLPNSRLESHEAEEADTALREREGERGGEGYIEGEGARGREKDRERGREREGEGRREEEGERAREGETHAWHLPGDAAANSKRRRVYPRARKQSLWNSHRKVDELV